MSARLLFTLLALNRAGRILWGVLIVGGAGVFIATRVWLPGARFSDQDEQLFRAARHGDVTGIERALGAGAGINDRSPIDGKTALFRAAVFGHADAVRLLLARGADVTMRGYDDRPAIEVVVVAITDEKDPLMSTRLNTVATALRRADSR
jgi:ankyrin repeat protein